MTINLLYLADARYGGWVTYTAHLAKSLLEAGHKVNIFKVGKRTESRMRGFGYGLTYQNLDLAAIKWMCRPTNTIVTALSKTKHELLDQILSVRPLLVIHDPAEMTASAIALSKQLGRPVVAIRKLPQQRLEQEGVPSVFIRHPYRPAAPTGQLRGTKAVSVSRIDWDKNSHITFGANELLDEHQQIQVYGALNPMYAHHKLGSLCPNWKNFYRGVFAKDEFALMELLKTSQYSVDFSLIKGDGGGTQYTFLEAWDAGSRLIIHNDWIRADDDLVPAKNCLTAGSAEELRDLLVGEASYEMSREDALAPHSPARIVPEYERLLLG